MVAGSDAARAVLRLAAWCLALSLVVSRAGLVGHELLGHGGAALAVGGTVTDLHLYTFAGGWIEYGGVRAWSPTALAVVSLAGVAIELFAAAVLLGFGRRRVALVAAGGALAVHALAYLAIGAADGLGDGAWLHQRLGDGRAAVALPATALAMLAAALLGRHLGAALLATLPPRGRGPRLALLAAALALAGAAHAALVIGELRLRPDPTYTRVMATARERAIDRDLAAWRAAAAARGELDAAHERVAQRQIAERHQARRWGPIIAVAIAVVAALGLAGARTERHAPLPRTTVRRITIAAAIAVAMTVAIDVAARGFW